jgi:K+-sensing histidine kinase KdpD
VKRQTNIFFYVLSAYVVLQFVWWGYHLIELSSEIAEKENQPDRILMIIGEGSVFFLILLLGLWKIRSSIINDLRLSQRQSNFLLSVTHELKTPLASNKLYLQTLLKRSTLDRENQEKLLNRAILENKRLEGMIENILTATRIENHVLNLRKEKINLSNLLKETAEKWATERRKVSFDIITGIESNADTFVIETVLLNLLDNANKYAGKAANIEVYLYKENSILYWGVKDDGIGVPEKFSSAIFNKFVRIGNEETRIEKGTGLGLYIVRQLIHAHGDEVKYEVNKPSGANFKIKHYDD